MQFIETRGNDNNKPAEVTFSEAILSPSASFGGLYVPKELPNINKNFIDDHKDSSYKILAKSILEKFKIDIESNIIDDALSRYDQFDDANDPVPVVKIDNNLYICELYHGPTRAFKDMALQPFGKILSALAQKKEEHYLILAATSGDTGPAALSTFKDQPYIQVVCLYPDGGTSDVQRLQMVTMDGDNLKVLGIKGNFDDAQNSLKKLLASKSFKKTLELKDIKLSAANSVNFGRIIFQIIYHIHSYIQLIKKGNITFGDKIYLIVPSGNFGNALGGYYAMKMGLPIEKILIASNENSVLAELINEGKYDLRDKTLKNTTSPAMDILKSSNVERILYDLFGSNRTKELMDSLESHNFYELNKDELKTLREIFDASYSSDKEVSEVIQNYSSKGYIMDTHTATALKCFKNNREKDLPTVVYSTAEWTKFAPTVLTSIESNSEKLHDKDALEIISKKYNMVISDTIRSIFDKQEIHTTIIDKDNIENSIVDFL